jgi:Uma2 family endonuclease
MRYEYPIIDLDDKYFHFENMSDEQFIQFALDNKNLRIERLKDKSIIIIAPAGGNTGVINSRIIARLDLWAEKKVGVAFDSNTMFSLPDNSMLSPDAAWISDEKWFAIPSELRSSIPKICPDFVIELQSETNNIKYLKDKMQSWISNGCKLAWLVSPHLSKVFIYRADGSVEEKPFSEKIIATEVVPGFELDLSFIEELKK